MPSASSSDGFAFLRRQLAWAKSQTVTLLVVAFPLTSAHTVRLPSSRRDAATILPSWEVSQSAVDVVADDKRFGFGKRVGARDGSAPQFAAQFPLLDLHQ
jgi:hypothetical protein